jgi:hypothetical protein
MKVLNARSSVAWRGIVSAAVGGTVLIGTGLVAQADDVANNLDSSVDATKEVLNLTAGGANGTVTLFVDETNGDGKTGCNLTGQTTLVVNVISSAPSVASMSPNQVTFGSCGDEPTLTISPLSAGSTDVSLALVSENALGTFNLTPAAFTVNVGAPTPPANTAPTVNVTGVVDGASYEIGTVPAATCSVTDEEDGNSTFPATVSGSGLGSQTAGCSYTDSGGLTANASVTYSVVDTGDPTITYVTRTPANANGWNNTDVTVEWTCEDAGSGVVAPTATEVVTTEGENQGATGTCTDNAGHTVSHMVSGINIDKTAPVATATQTPEANANGWNNTDVTVAWTCQDDRSGEGAVSEPVTFDQEGGNQSASGSCTDKAGNESEPVVEVVNIDETAPELSSTRTAPNGHGWNNGPVTVAWDCIDGLSGVDNVSPEQTFAAEGEGQMANGTCTDLAGNTESGTVADINIDRSAPTVSLVDGPTNSGGYYYGFVPTAPTCTANDALSGMAGDCMVSGSGTSIGTHTVMATATDRAGNTATDTRTYTVSSWTLKGFYQPVDMGTTVNTVKNGSTVPLKFEVFAGNTELTDPSIISSFKLAKASCATGASTDEIELTSTGGTSLRYDATGGQFIQNWQTPKEPGACYKVTMTTDDGSSISANFKFK